MSKKIYLIIVAALISLVNLAKESLPTGFKEQRLQTVSFTENKGQFVDQNNKPRPDILFGGSDGQITFHIANSGISYQLFRVDKYKESVDPKTNEKIKEIEQQTIYRTDIKWLNANTTPIVKTDGALPGYTNYYLEQCSIGALNVKSYKGVTLQNIYNQIDLHYYEKNGQLKCDYIVAPHADYKQIQLKVEGAELQLQKDGSLLIKTPLGKIEEQAPLVYQNGKQLKARYNIKNNIISFEIENYNAIYELIIDPVTRLWGTYYGGTGTDFGDSVGTDGLGNVFMTGYSASNTATLIASTGSHQSIYGGGTQDAFLVKFNSSGVRQWGTYYGGTGVDYGYSCSSDASGNIYMGGHTSINSGTVIATAGSHQGAHGGGTWDAFLVKFDANGIRQWGTYYGGTGNEWVYSCSIDASGDVYITGYSSTNTGTVIATSGSHQNTHGGGTDAFLVKFNSSGVRQWGTYYGGSSSDVGFSCTTDASGNVYMAGQTNSNTGTVIATIGSHQNIYGGGTNDAYLVKFNSNGVRQWGTYYGGGGDDRAEASVITSLNTIYVSGYTNSSTSTLIATVGSHQSSFGGGTFDAFLVAFNNSGVRQWGTYYGDSGTDYGYSCATDASGDVYMTGQTSSNTGTMIATVGSHQNIHGGGTDDAYLVKFNNSGVRQWGTYYGGSGNDYSFSCAIDATGNLFMSGSTASNASTVIATAGSHQTVLSAGIDSYLVKFAECNTLSQPSVISGAVSICFGSSQTYSVTNDPFATNYTWILPGGWSGTSTTNTISAIAGATGIFTVTANDACSSSPQQTLQIIVNPLPTINASTTNTVLCIGQSTTITAIGASTYTFIPGGASTSIIVSPTVNTTYTITGTDSNGCVNSSVFTQTVSACVDVSELSTTNYFPNIYPNPTSGVLNISGVKNQKIEVYNVVGKIIYNNEVKEDTLQIDLRNESSGIYFIKIGTAIKKIIKE